MNDYLEFLLDYKHRYTEAQIKRLQPAEINELYDLSTTSEQGLIRQKAIQILARASPELIRPDLEKTLANDTAPERLRLLAVAYLNLMAYPATEALYLKLLSRQDLPLLLQVKLIKGLSQFGTYRALDLLARLENRPQLENMITLATVLISAREKRPFSRTYALDPPRPYEPEDRETIRPQIRPAVVLPYTYGLALSDSAYFYECVRSHYTILPARSLDLRPRKYPQMAAILALRSRFDDSYHANMLVVLMPPEREESQIVVYRTDGLICYGGRLGPDGTFLLSTQKKFADDQVFLQGQWDDRQLEFKEFSSSRQLKNKKRPLPLSMN